MKTGRRLRATLQRWNQIFPTHYIGNYVQRRFRVRIDVKISAVYRAITNAPPQGNYRRLACFTERFDDLQFIFTGNGVAKDENVESALLTVSKIFHSIGPGQAALVPDDSEVPRTASMSASGPSTPYKKVSASVGGHCRC
jgi:hypothetical protein